MTVCVPAESRARFYTKKKREVFRGLVFRRDIILLKFRNKQSYKKITIKYLQCGFQSAIIQCRYKNVVLYALL